MTTKICSKCGEVIDITALTKPYCLNCGQAIYKPSINVSELSINQQKTLRDEFAMAALTGMSMTVERFNDCYRHIPALVDVIYSIADECMKRRLK